MSRLAIGALALLALGGAVLVARFRKELQAQAQQIFVLRSVELARSGDESRQQSEIERLKILRGKLLSSGAEAIVDRGEVFTLDQLNQRLGALGVV